MLFGRSYLLMIIGIILLVLCTFMTFFAPFFIIIMFLLIGVIMVIMSLLLVHLRAISSTLGRLLDDPKRKRVFWLYVYGDRDIIVTPAIRQLEKHSYSKEMDQQIQDFQTYSFAGHKVRIVPEGVGHSVSLGKCLYANFVKREWNVKTLNELRKYIFSEKKPAKEEATSIKKYKEMKEEESNE